MRTAIASVPTDSRARLQFIIREKKCQYQTINFNILQNNKTLKRFATETYLPLCFNYLQNNKTLKPQIFQREYHSIDEYGYSISRTNSFLQFYFTLFLRNFQVFHINLP